MQTITIDGQTFDYETVWNHGQDFPSTHFYQDIETYSYRKYLFFGKVITKTRPKLVFTIYADSKNINLTKGWWLEKIRHEIELLGRAQEIEKGELI